MSLAISCRQPSLDTELDPHFGRAPCFCLIKDADAGSDDQPPSTRFLSNPHADGQHGAGIRTAEYLVELGVTTVISGDFGPKAMAVLRAAKCHCYRSKPDSLPKILAAWQQQQLTRVEG